MIIELTFTRDLYVIFYQLAFGSFLIILIAEGIKRKYPLSTWLLLTAFVSSCMIIGSKLNSSLFNSIRILSLDPHTIDFSQKSAINGFLLGILGLVAVSHYFKIKRSIYDVFAFALPVMMLFQRLGCLMAGCCYGKETECSLGIHYQGISSLLDQQINAGLVPFDSEITNAVHPVPLYFVFASLIIIALLFLVKKRLKQSGSLALLSLLSMMTARFIIEFFRDPLTNVLLGKTILGLQMLQWILLPMIIIGSFFLFKREQKQTVSNKPDVQPIRIERNLAFIVLFSLFIFSIRNWLKTEEIAVLHLQIGVSAIALLFTALTTQTIIRYNFMGVFIVLLAFTVMSFSYSFDEKKAMFQSDTLPDRLVLSGNYQYNSLLKPYYPCSKISQGFIGEYCSNRNYSRPFGPTYNSLSFGLERAFASNKINQWVMGVDGQLENFYNSNIKNAEYRANLHFFAGRENEYGNGIRFGLKVGSMFRPEVKTINSSTYVLPTIRAKIGVEGILYLHASLFESDIMGTSSAASELKLSSDVLKKVNPKIGNFGIGIGFLMTGTNYYFIQNEFALSSQMVIKPSFGFLKDELPNKKINASLGIRYHLPTKKQ